MADSITSLIPTTGPFDTAAIQIAQAQAQAAAAHTNEVAFLQEIAKTNADANAQALNGTSANAPTDPLANLQTTPSDPLNLAFLTDFGSNVATAATSDSIIAQQLHDAAVLQKDAALLEQAANDTSHIPLGNSASTVDLSPKAQDIISGATVGSISTSAPLSPAQLTQIGNILQPIANEPLTPALLQQIQSQLAAGQNSLQLSLTTMNLAMNFIAALQQRPYHMVKNIVVPEDKEVVAPVSAINRVAIEDGAIH